MVIIRLKSYIFSRALGGLSHLEVMIWFRSLYRCGENR